MRLLFGLAACLSVLVQSGAAIDLVLGNEDSVKSAASTIAFGLVKYYTGRSHLLWLAVFRGSRASSVLPVCKT